MADQIVAEYLLKTDKAIKELERIQKQLDATEKKGKSTSSSLIDSFKGVGAAIGIAFGTQQVVQFGKEAVMLASKLEGVERAFNKLNQPNLLADLRKATRGTVTDLELMRQAVRAQNFKVPLEQLAKFFEFATKRSIETGESVDYLVNSIIDGIGRKSTLVLDNLGISATELQAEIKKTGDFGEAAGNIISRSLEETGEVADTTAIKIAQLNVALENTKTAVGTGIVAGLTDLTDELGETGESLKNLTDETDGTTLATEAFQKIVETVAIPIRLVNGYLKTQIDLLDWWKDLLGITSEEIEEVTSKSEGLAGIFAFLNKQMQSDGEGGGVVNNITNLNKELKDLKKRLSDAVIGSTEFFNITEKIEAKTKELNEAIAQTKLADAFKLDEDEPFESVGDGLVELGDGIEKFASDSDDRLKQWRDDMIQNAKDTMDGMGEAFDENGPLGDIGDELQEAFQLWQSFFNSLNELQRLQNDLALQDLQNRFNKEEITREQFEAKKKELMKKEAAQQKSFALFTAILNTAAAVTNALNTQPFLPLGPIMAALAAASGAAQIGIIASQPTPQFAEGGWVDSKGFIHGRSHAHGGVKIEAEGDEFIVKGRRAKPNAKILEAINSGNWEQYKMENIIAPAIESVLDGGFEGLAASYALQSNFNDKNLLRAIDRHRSSDTAGFKYLAKELKGQLRGSKRGGYA